MAKRKPKSPDVERLDIQVVAGFEGDKCVFVRILQPSLSWKRRGSMGVKLQKLADVMFQKEVLEADMQEIDKELHFHMRGTRS